MQWSADRNAGFSRANSQKLFLPTIIDPVFSYEALNVESQHDNLHSLLWWMRRLIALRRRYKAMSRGSLEFLYPANRKILAFIRRYEEQRLLVVANLSRFTQYAELDLSALRGMVPIEAFGHTRFPAIGANPYFLTLAPHCFHWFVLQEPRSPFDVVAGSERVSLPAFSTEERWLNWFEPENKAVAEEFLAQHLPTRRWFGGKSRPLKSTEIVEVIPIGDEPESSCILLVRADYLEGDPELYLFTMAYATGAAAEEAQKNMPDAVLARLSVGQERGILYGGVRERGFCLELLDVIGRRRRVAGRLGELCGVPTRSFRALRGNGEAPEPHAMGVDQSNTSLSYDNKLLLKLFRKLEEGLNPDVEIGLFLGEETSFQFSAKVAGYLEYRVPDSEPITLGVLQAFVPNEGDAWQFTLDQVSQYFERTLALSETGNEPPLAGQTLLELSQGSIPRFSHDLVGPYLEAARLLGQRTAEMHLALASDAAAESPKFAPEPFTLFYQRSLLQSFRNLTEVVFEALSRQLGNLPEGVRAQAERVLGLKPRILEIFRFIVSRNIVTVRTRFHGDYHLGQALWTGRDFVIIDFEGEPARPVSARRIKRSPLRDTASMIRSFDYAVHRGLRNLTNKSVQAPEALERLERFAEHWFQWASSAFLRSYLRTAGEAPFVPKTREELSGMLDVFLLEKAIYELGYELDHRPDWLSLPLGGIEWLVSRAAR
jgi:maltose alpha-D-glucosyltransferase/alpha-amylase